ncbi:MAG: nuclear transport factor 2 family protein [Steroidobacteraceae bacterium]|nr:nuclear transport factor 2 family protein [Steroidobacteraceae bacterium]
MRTRLTTLVALIVCGGVFADSGDAATVALIVKLEQQRIDAGLRKDVAALEATTADDYLQIDMAGNVRDKATQMKRIASSEVKMVSNTLDDLVVRVYGETAVVTGRATAVGTIRGEPYPRIRFTRVYVKQGATWKVVLFQQTRTG